MSRRVRFNRFAPRRCYGFAHGSNTWAEWRAALRHYGNSTDMHDLREVLAFEREFAAVAGATHAFSFGAGRMALYAILTALNIGPGDEVIIPAYTCVVVPNAILYRGAMPVYVDIDLRTFNIDAAKVVAAITPKTRALYAQHTFGLICDVDALREIGQRHHLPVIEDVGHALGALHQGHPAGSLTEAALFTTDSTKTINTKLGGMATTSNAAVAQNLAKTQAETPWLHLHLERRLIRSFILEYPLSRPSTYWFGRTVCGVLNRAGLIFQFKDELSLTKPTGYEYPARLSSFQAELGRSQLSRLSANLDHRRRIGLALEERVGWLGKRLEKDAENHAFLRYSFLVKDPLRFARRFGMSFEPSFWFTSVVHGRDTDLEKVGYCMGSCPNGEFAAQHIVNLPTHTGVDTGFILGKVDRHLQWFREEILYPPAGVELSTRR